MKCFAVIVVVLLSGSSVWAQCTRDTDCKGDRICEDGKCVEPATSAPAVPLPAMNGSTCRNGSISFMGKCRSRDWIVTAGNMSFGPTLVFYGLGALYNSIAPNILAQVTYREVTSDYSDDAYAAILPQSSIYIIFGYLNQIPKHKQSRYLDELGSTGATSMQVAGYLLHSASVATILWSGLSYRHHNKNLTVAASAINSAVIISGFVVNILGYVKQRKMLGDAVDKQINTSAVDWTPYFSMSGEEIGGGMAFRF